MIPAYRDTLEKTHPEYKIAYGSYMTDLENLVKHYLERGWELQGGVSVSADGHLWAQAIIKR